MNGLFEGFVSDLGLDGGYVNEAEIAEEMERLEEMAPAKMGADDPIEACYEAMVANERNYSKIMMSVAHEEFQYYVANGTQMVYEGARLDAFFDKIKDLADRAWTKIKSIFEKAIAHINSWISTDKRFVEKFGDKIREASTGVLEVNDAYDIKGSEGFTDKYSEIANNVSSIVGNFGMGSFKPGKDSLASKNPSSFINLQLYGAENSTKESYISEYKKEIGLDKKVTFKPNGDQVITELKEGKQNKKNVKLAYNDSKKSIASLKKSVDKAKSEANKAGNNTDGASYSTMSRLCSNAISLMHSVQSVQLQALSAYHKQCRKSAAQVVRGKKDTSTSESYVDSSFADLLE